MTNCPKCPSETLVKTSKLANIPLDVCPGCSGIWFDKGELEELLKKSEGNASADLNLINPKAEGPLCPRCKTNMSHGGLINPLLLVDKCQSCGGIWLDSRELELLKKLLGISGGPSEIKVSRPVPEPEVPQTGNAKSVAVKILAGIAALLGLAGVSFELYLYYSPAGMASHQPSPLIAVVSVILAVTGIFTFLHKK